MRMDMNEKVCGVLGAVGEVLLEVADFGNLLQTKLASSLAKDVDRWYTDLCIMRLDVNLLRSSEKESLCRLFSELERFLVNTANAEPWFIDKDELNAMVEKIGSVRRGLCHE